MALTQEQLESIEFQKAQNNISNKNEAFRMARDIVFRNDENKPVSERGITAQDIINTAETLKTYLDT